MVIDLIVCETDDGYTGEVPSVKGCECWSMKEDDVINKSIELLRFYLNLKEKHEIKIDLARKEEKIKIYKIIFNKDN